MFSDVSADVCTDPECFKSKTETNVIRIKQLATAKGQTVISGAEAKKIMPNSYSSTSLGGGYVSLDSTNYTDPKKRTYRQLIGKNDAPIVLLDNPHSTEVKEIVKVADIKELLQEKGVSISKSEGEGNASKEREKEQEAKAKVERAYRTELFTQVHHASLMMNLVDADLRLLARIMYNNLPGGTIPTKLVMSLHGWTDETFTYPDREEKLKAAFDALSPAQLNQLIRDCMLSHDLHVNVYTSYSDKDEPNRLLAMAERTKIDAKAIKKQFVDEAKAKADLKKKAAAKKAEKTAPKAKVDAPTVTPAPQVKKEAKKVAPAKKAPATKAAATPATAKPRAPTTTTKSSPEPVNGPTAINAAEPGPDSADIPPLAGSEKPAVVAWPFPTSTKTKSY